MSEDRVPGIYTAQRAPDAHHLSHTGHDVGHRRRVTRRRGPGLLRVLVVHHRGHVKDGAVHGWRSHAGDHMHGHSRYVQTGNPKTVVEPQRTCLTINRRRFSGADGLRRRRLVEQRVCPMVLRPSSQRETAEKPWETHVINVRKQKRKTHL